MFNHFLLFFFLFLSFFSSIFVLMQRLLSVRRMLQRLWVFILYGVILFLSLTSRTRRYDFVSPHIFSLLISGNVLLNLCDSIVVIASRSTFRCLLYCVLVIQNSILRYFSYWWPCKACFPALPVWCEYRVFGAVAIFCEQFVAVIFHVYFVVWWTNTNCLARLCLCDITTSC